MWLRCYGALLSQNDILVVLWPHRMTKFKLDGKKKIPKRKFKYGGCWRIRSPWTSKEKNVTDEKKILNEDRWVTYSQIEEILGLNALTIRFILKYRLYVKKLYCLWASKSLNENQNLYVWGALKMFDKRQLREIITVDEAWLYYYDVPTRSQNKV